MAQILCTHPNCSSEVNGVAFSKVREGMLSEDMPMEKAKVFEAMGEHFHLIKSEADKRQEFLADSATEMHGPKGVLHLAGDYSRSDLEALRAHWAKGSISDPAVEAPPAPLPAPTKAPVSSLIRPGLEGEPGADAAGDQGADKGAGETGAGSTRKKPLIVA